MGSFAEIFKNLRVQRGMSQADLARIIGVARTTVSSYENGTRTPDRETLIKIASCYQVSLDYLLGTDTLGIDSSSHYSAILKEINSLLTTTPIDSEKKKEIVNEVRDYFRWKLQQAEQNRISEEE
ncbi:MAG: helix-turn-helix transcriptional regulator [Syntrophomonadaceae bacterium]|nr:helix-turn-helix transcriptional regulator [Syntrophomonadaceae bacterium]